MENFLKSNNVPCSEFDEQDRFKSYTAIKGQEEMGTAETDTDSGLFDTYAKTSAQIMLEAEQRAENAETDTEFSSETDSVRPFGMDIGSPFYADPLSAETTKTDNPFVVASDVLDEAEKKLGITAVEPVKSKRGRKKAQKAETPVEIMREKLSGYAAEYALLGVLDRTLSEILIECLSPESLLSLNSLPGYVNTPQVSSIYDLMEQAMSEIKANPMQMPTMSKLLSELAIMLEAWGLIAKDYPDIADRTFFENIGVLPPQVAEDADDASEYNKGHWSSDIEHVSSELCICIEEAKDKEDTLLKILYPTLVRLLGEHTTSVLGFALNDAGDKVELLTGAVRVNSLVYNRGVLFTEHNSIERAIDAVQLLSEMLAEADANAALSAVDKQISGYLHDIEFGILPMDKETCEEFQKLQQRRRVVKQMQQVYKLLCGDMPVNKLQALRDELQKGIQAATEYLCKQAGKLYTGKLH